MERKNFSKEEKLSIITKKHFVIKNFKEKSIDVKQMSNVRGGIKVSLENLKINITKLKKEVAVSQDKGIEVSGTLTVEQ